MKLKKKIFVITTCRADYYLLRPLLQQINKSKKLKGCLVATGSHISKKHGYTIKSIKKDFKSVKVVKLKNKSENNTVNSMVGEGIKNFGKFIKKNNPDAIMILGDRYEALSASVASIFFTTLCQMRNIDEELSNLEKIQKTSFQWEVLE